MSEEKMLNLSEKEGLYNNDDQQSWFTFQNLYAMLVLNWQWFVLTIFICLCGALIYLRYTQPIYSVSSRMLIKDDNNRKRSGSNMLANMQDLGFMTNSAGIENEIEILQSHILVRDAIKSLKLYTEYYNIGYLKERLIYKTQPINVDLDPESLDSLDKVLLEETRSMDLVITPLNNGYKIEGDLLRKGEISDNFTQELSKFPASIKTKFGVLTFTENSINGLAVNPRGVKVKILPPMFVAKKYLANLSVAPTSKQTTIAEIKLKNENVRRGIDFLLALAESYNNQANADKNEIALKTEEFINERINKINEELGNTEGTLEQYKKRNSVTKLEMDATQSLQMSSQYGNKLAEANSQIQLLDYLREFIDNPNNQYKIIPSNVGMTDQASTALIGNYNKTVQDRNRLLKVASEQAPQVQTLTATLDELQGSIRTALLQARRTADINRQGIQNQYAKYQNRIGSTPEQERILTEIGRQQEVRSGLYLMLLQKREENSISLAATADNGKLIDEPQYEGKVSPKSAIILLAALILGVAMPMGVILLLQFFRFRIEGHDDLEKLTNLPIVADVPVASETVKDASGIVVKANRNDQIDEIFRSLRTNIQFMMKEGEQVILFTSSTSGEGKTFLAANLAVSFAILGKKTILCGLDIRKPALGRLFKIDSERNVGVSRILVKDNVTEENVMSQVVPSGINGNIDLLLAGPIPPNPTELLARQNLPDMIEVLKRKYDYVILDTAPVGLVSDTLQIAKYANVSCYVCRADYTPKAEIGILNSLANESKLTNACVILNGVDMSKKKYGYYYGYGKYGKYGRYGYGKYGYGKYGYGNYGNYGNYADYRYSNKNDNSIKK